MPARFVNPVATISRTKVRTIPCPACTAKAGQKCRNSRGRERESNHLERVEMALELRERGYARK